MNITSKPKVLLKHAVIDHLQPPRSIPSPLSLVKILISDEQHQLIAFLKVFNNIRLQNKTIDLFKLHQRRRIFVVPNSVSRWFRSTRDDPQSEGRVVVIQVSANKFDGYKS